MVRPQTKTMEGVQQRYRKELRVPEKQEQLRHLRALMRKGSVHHYGGGGGDIVIK
jgi:hypothetical protein